MYTKRVQVLFPMELHDQLVAVAVQRETSVGDLIRKAVEVQYGNDTATLRERRQKHYARLLAHQKKVGVSRGMDFRALIEDGRVR